MWEPRHLTTLWAFTSYYRDRFTIFIIVILWHLRFSQRWLKSTVLWDITPCSPLKADLHFKGTCCFHMEIIHFSGVSLSFLLVIWSKSNKFGPPCLLNSTGTVPGPVLLFLSFFSVPVTTASQFILICDAGYFKNSSQSSNIFPIVLHLWVLILWWLNSACSSEHVLLLY
jgi:hypothetical protein